MLHYSFREGRQPSSHGFDFPIMIIVYYKSMDTVSTLLLWLQRADTVTIDSEMTRCYDRRSEQTNYCPTGATDRFQPSYTDYHQG